MALELSEEPIKRQNEYQNLTMLLGLEVPGSFLDILNSIDPTHPRDLDERLKNTRGLRFDFIGSGISGVTGAYVAGELSRIYSLGWKIHVWERLEGPGLKSTKDSAARSRTSMFGSKEETIGNLVTSLFFENLPHILSNCATESGNKFDEDDVHVGLHRCGYLWMLEYESMSKIVASNRKLLKEIGIPSFILEPREVKKLLMPGINIDRFNFAYFCPTDSFVEPTSIVNALYNYSRKILGVSFHFNQEITRIKIDTGRQIAFETQYIGSVQPTKEYQANCNYTDRLGITTGACSKELGKRIVINGADASIYIPVIPKARQLTHVGGFSEDELKEHETFNILMGNGAYWSRESPRSNQLIFGFARPNDPEIPPERIFDETNPSMDYFIESIIQEGRLDGIHRDIGLNSKMDIRRHSGNLYGETIDGNYLVGLLSHMNHVRPDGKIGINSGDNGHGIMASLRTSVHLVYRLTGIIPEEIELLNPNRIMKADGGTVRL